MQIQINYMAIFLPWDGLEGFPIRGNVIEKRVSRDALIAGLRLIKTRDDDGLASPLGTFPFRDPRACVAAVLGAHGGSWGPGCRARRLLPASA